MNLEQELHRLSKVNPSSKFSKKAKLRLMHQIAIQDSERVWLRALFNVRQVNPNRSWVSLARKRLLSRVQVKPETATSWIAWMRRTTASALAMVIAVTAVLFSVGSKQPVNASDNTYLEVKMGQVEVKRADKLDWLTVSENTELSAGDLVRVPNNAMATIYFFDDSQIRLSDNSLLLISRTESSPGFGQQGIIEVALHQGRAWVQTLNVEDDFARFSLVTREAIISAINSSFDVSTDWFEPTEVRVFKRSVKVEALNSINREVIAEGRLSTGEQIILSENNKGKQDTLAALASIEPVSQKTKLQSWVMQNLEGDQLHLSDLKDREWIRLQAATKVLPGDFLYPIKRAKERLSLALSFGSSAIADAQIDIANQRLAESIVLIQKGQRSKAKAVLADYSEIIDDISKLAQKSEQVKQDFSNKVVASKQKVLLAALPSDAKVGLVKQALDKSEELLAKNPLEKAEVRLQNALDNLASVQEFVANGDLKSAQETLINQDVTALDVLKVAENLEDEEKKKALYARLLEAQYAQQHLLNQIKEVASSAQSDEIFAKLIENTNQKLEAGIKTTVSVVLPIIPDVLVADTTPLPELDKITAFVEKVNIYRTSRGQENQIARLLKQNPQQARDIDFLRAVRDKFKGVARKAINQRMVVLQKQLKASKNRRVKLKIDRSKRLRD